MQIHKCDSFPRSVICEFVRCPSSLIYSGRPRSGKEGRKNVHARGRKEGRPRSGKEGKTSTLGEGRKDVHARWRTGKEVVVGAARAVTPGKQLINRRWYRRTSTLLAGGHSSPVAVFHRIFEGRSVITAALT